jgi:hypothetical protein
MLSLASQKPRVAPDANQLNNQQSQYVGDLPDGNIGQSIKIEAEADRAQRTDDAIELEQDAARLARNAIGISHKIVSTNQGINQLSQSSLAQASAAASFRAIPKDPVSDRRLSHYQHQQSPSSSGGTRKRSLFGEPAKQVTMHRPSGAHSQSGVVVVS